MSQTENTKSDNDKKSLSKCLNDGTDNSSSSSSSSSSSLPNVPDGGWGWVIVAASFMAHLLAEGCESCIGVLFSELLESFEETKGKTAWVGSLFISMPAICGPIASIITNKFGCRRTTIAGGLIGACGCILGCFATSIATLCLTFGIIAGFGLSLVYVPAVVIVAFYFEDKRAFATGIAVAGSGVGTFVFAPLMDILIDKYTWQGALLILGGMMLNIVLCGALFRPLVSFKIEKRRRKYLRSLEKFSKVSSRFPSDEGFDKKSICEHSNGIPSCAFCNDMEPLSHSLVQFPTYLQVKDLDLELPKILPNARQNSHSMSEITVIHENSTKFQDIARNSEITAIAEKIEEDFKSNHQNLQPNPQISKVTKCLKSVAKRNLNVKKQNRKNAHFTEHFMPRYRADIVYRGSLLKAGFLMSRGQSSSCPDIFVSSHQKKMTIHAHMRELGILKMLNSIRDELDFSIFQSPIFIYFCLHCMLLNISRDIPYVYLLDTAVSSGIEARMAPWLISIIGIVSSIGQVIMGYIGDLPQINCLYFYIAMTTVAGLVTMAVPFLETFAMLAAYCTAFGFFISANYALTTVIVVDLLGMNQLTNAYGFVSLAEGIANLLGPPFAGWVSDETGSYSPTFYLSGAIISLSALMLFLVPCLRKCDKIASGTWGDVDNRVETYSAHVQPDIDNISEEIDKV